jgi:hypothetical protein
MNQNNSREELINILIELTDATGFDHTAEALFAFERAKEKIHQELQKAREEVYKEVQANAEQCYRDNGRGAFEPVKAVPLHKLFTN